MTNRTLANGIATKEVSSDYDKLTGLLNRSEFEEKLKLIPEYSRTKNETHALCQIDIDAFKVINDVYGQASGDALLCSITELIENCIRSEDVLARIGNDEFGLIIKNCSLNNAVMVANNIRESIKNFRMSTDSNIYGVTVSIGVILINEANIKSNTIVKNVDIACHAAKQTGDKVHVYDGEDNLIATYHQDMKWVNKINNGIDNDHFDLFAQQILPLTASEMMSKPIVCEILLRMFDKDGNEISPDKFLPVAATHNLASRIDLMVIDKAINYLQSNLDIAKKTSMIMINLSGQSLGDEKILNFLNDKLADVDFSTEILCFEITEAETIKNLSAAINFINFIRNKFGCLFALDDFGAGFCSFKYIKELPVDIIKIDGSFVRDIHHDPISEIMIQALNDIAQVTDKKTIAEWVENKEVLDTLQDMGVDYGQGYFLDRPMPLDSFMSKY